MALGNSKLLKDATTAESKKAFSPASFPLWWKAVLFAVAYFLCAETGTFLSARGGTYVGFWLPAGLSVGVLLLSRTKDWPWFLLAIFPANILFDYFRGTKFPVYFLFSIGNAIQPFIAAWLLRKFVSKQPTLATLKEFFGLVGFAAVFSTIPSAIIGAATLVHFGLSDSFERTWKVWWGSTAMAVLVFSSFILTWFSKPNTAHDFFNPPKKAAEVVLLFLGLSIFVSYLLVWDQGIMSPDMFWITPFLLWAGLRFGLRGATAINLFLALLISFFTAQFSCGLTPAQISSGEYVFVLQTVLAMAVLISLIPAIVIGERDRTTAELRESEERFKNLAAAAFEGICISQNGRILDVNNQFLTMLGYQRSEIIGHQIIEVVAPESRELVVESVYIGRETVYKHQLLRKDGSTFFAEAQAKMVRVGERTLRMTALRDITDRLRAEHEREQAMAREQKARTEYTFQIIALQEAERTRIARELHDSLGQDLLLIKNHAQLQMTKAKLPDDLRAQFQNISEIASRAIAEARHIAHDLHPQQLDLLGLTRALQSLIENTDESSAMLIDGKFDPVDDVFSREAATNIYRIVQESLNNIFKHSRAKNARIRLERDVHEVVLKIEDDGCGFETEESKDARKGLGLKSITERVRMLDGKIKLDSQPGNGTHIEITIPISDEHG